MSAVSWARRGGISSTRGLMRCPWAGLWLNSMLGPRAVGSPRLMLRCTKTDQETHLPRAFVRRSAFHYILPPALRVFEDCSENDRCRCQPTRPEMVPKRAVWASALGRCASLFCIQSKDLVGLEAHSSARFRGKGRARSSKYYPSVRIALPWKLIIGDHAAVGDRSILYGLGPIAIGARVTISQGAHLCAGTHDWRTSDMLLLKPPIHIGDDAWICADAFIGPGVTIGRGAIVGARAVAMKDIPENAICVGNPAHIVSHRRMRGPQ